MQGGTVAMGHVWTILLSIIIAVAVVAALVILLLKSSFWLRVKYKKELEVWVGYGFIRTKVIPENEEKLRKKKEKRRKKLQKAAEKKAKSEKTSEEHKTDVEDGGKTSEEVREQEEKTTADIDHRNRETIEEAITEIIDIIKKLAELLGTGAWFKISTLKISVSKPDAADTAIQYGICCAGVSTILAAVSLFKNSKIKDKNVFVNADYITGKSKAQVDMTIGVTLLDLILYFAIPYVKQNILNERKIEK